MDDSSTGSVSSLLPSCVFDHQSLIVAQCTDALGQALGHEDGQAVVGLYVLDLFSPASYEGFEHFLRGGDYGTGVRCNLSRDDGDGGRVAVGILPAPVEAGPDHLMLLCVPIEDDQAHLTELEKTIGILRDQNERLGDFTNLVIHDLRNTLQGITTGLELLEMGLSGLIAGKTRRNFERVMRASTTMNGILSGVTNYMRFEVGAYPMELTDINALVDSLVLAAEGPTGRNVSIRRTDELPTLICEQQLVHELFRNVVGNAIKYCDKNPIEIEIGVEESEFSAPVFFIKDNGVGISEADLVQVFNPFTRADHAGLNTKGTGMGMALVKRIVERHGGKIWLESEPQQGTTVRFSLNP